jgi:hypothetical protein
LRALRVCILVQTPLPVVPGEIQHPLGRGALGIDYDGGRAGKIVLAHIIQEALGRDLGLGVSGPANDRRAILCMKSGEQNGGLFPAARSSQTQNSMVSMKGLAARRSRLRGLRTWACHSLSSSIVVLP